MNLTSGIVEIDLHGLRVEDAIRKVKNAVNAVPKSVYTIRVIHGYHGGTAIREAIEDEFCYGRNDKVKEVRRGTNPGITELVIRSM